MSETFKLMMELTQDEINTLGELAFNCGDYGEENAGELYNKLVNAASEAGADLP